MIEVTMTCNMLRVDWVKSCLYTFCMLKSYQLRKDGRGLEQIAKPAVIECT